MIHTSHTNFREKIQIVLQSFGMLLVRVCFKPLFTIEIIGAEEAVRQVSEAGKKGKGMLFAANHASELDGPFIRTFLPFPVFTNPMYFVAMTSDQYNRGTFDWRTYIYGGFMFKLLGAFPAFKGMRDYQASLTNHIELLEQQKMVCIFPEGKINRDKTKAVEARGGVSFLAEFTDTNIIPVFIQGLEDVPWKKAFLLKRPKIIIEYKPMLQIAELMQDARDRHVPTGADMYKDVARQVMDVIRSS